MATVSVWDRHEARLLLRGAYRRVRSVATTLGLLAGLGVGLGVSRLLGQGGG